MPDSKHLEFLQATITRMAGNSFLAKGWSITLVTALLTLALKEGMPDMALISLLPLAMFWLVDAYYLALERGFRTLFEDAAATYSAGKAPDFKMAPRNAIAALPSAMFRPAILIIHLPLVAVVILVWRLL